jgi:hypothetical protein
MNAMDAPPDLVHVVEVMSRQQSNLPRRFLHHEKYTHNSRVKETGPTGRGIRRARTGLLRAATFAFLARRETRALYPLGQAPATTNGLARL